MSVILKAINLNKTYTMGQGNNQRILKDINMEIKKGEFVAVMGPSGSGKSTLLYNISSMDKMTSGNVEFDGKELSLMSQNELSKIRLKFMGFIFQRSNLLKNLNIFDNIILPAYQAKLESRKKINKRAYNLMQRTGIESLVHNDITQASGGELQRASICRALINNPNIIFADEPTGALNSSNTFEVLKILKEINNTGTTILMVTHNPRVAAISDRVLFMKDGRIVADKTLDKNRDKTNYKKQEAILSEWLIKQGF